ncbi:MAG: hypothetical protein JXB60_02175 [Candidatus Cloacimonetes bacterium]|nr:hypothetical protein [Candidatus Cloacimonadota bacterium]
MGKSTSMLIIIVILTLSACCGAQEDFYQPYQEYLESGSSAGFLKAWQYYHDNGSNRTGSDLILGYLHLTELDKIVSMLHSRVDSLDNGQKFSLANLMLGMGRYKDSIAIYEILNETIPNWSCPWRHKGEAFFRSGQLAEAETSLLQAITTRKEHFDAYVMLAETQLELGKPAEALHTLETGLPYRGLSAEEADPEIKDSDIEFLYLELLKANNREEEYQLKAEELKALFPEDSYWNSSKN